MDADEFQLEVTGALSRIENMLENGTAKMNDHEIRIRGMERKITLATGAFGVISGLLGAGFTILCIWVRNLWGGGNR